MKKHAIGYGVQHGSAKAWVSPDVEVLVELTGRDPEAVAADLADTLSPLVPALRRVWRRLLAHRLTRLWPAPNLSLAGRRLKAKVQRTLRGDLVVDFAARSAPDTVRIWVCPVKEIRAVHTARCRRSATADAVVQLLVARQALKKVTLSTTAKEVSQALGQPPEGTGSWMSWASGILLPRSRLPDGSRPRTDVRLWRALPCVSDPDGLIARIMELLKLGFAGDRR